LGVVESELRVAAAIRRHRVIESKRLPDSQFERRDNRGRRATLTRNLFGIRIAKHA
jgi:hypothetical protein